MIKVCTKCNITQPIDCFYKQPRGKFGVEGACKKCRNSQRNQWALGNESERINKKIRNKKWREQNVEYCRLKHKEWKDKNYTYLLSYFKEYNINRTAEQKKILRGNIIKKYWPGTNAIEALKNYDNILTKQNDCCAICKKHKSEFSKSLAIDHNHKTGKVRGALCYRCNRLYVSIHTIDTAFKVYQYLLENDT